MENRFFIDVIIDYFAVGPGLTVTTPWLIAYMQEASIRHINSTPFTTQWYSDNGFGYILTNWHIKINKYPKNNENIKIFTWPIFFKGILCERYFEMQDENKNILAWACSKWVYMDLNHRRPRKPPEEHKAGYGSLYPANFDYDFDFLSDIDIYSKINTGSIKITRKDIDSNFHVNNIKYIEWAVDNIPDDIYNSGRITEIKAAYKKECKYGQGLSIETYSKQDAETEILSTLNTDDESGGALFQAYFILRSGV